MKVCKDCDGKKIDKCLNCDYLYAPIKSFACGMLHSQIEDVYCIQSWCPLDDWEADHEKST